MYLDNLPDWHNLSWYPHIAVIYKGIEVSFFPPLHERGSNLHLLFGMYPELSHSLEKIYHNFFWHDRDWKVELLDDFDDEHLRTVVSFCHPLIPLLSPERLEYRFDSGFPKLLK